jgi:hypothetical protein
MTEPHNCEDCGKILDPEGGGMEDDIVSPMRVTDDGQELCLGCYAHYRQQEEDEYWQDPAGADGLP